VIQLPKSSADRMAVLDRMASAAEQYANIHKCRWLIDHYWMMGYRDLRINYATGQVDARLSNREDSSGQLQVLYEDAVVKLQSEMGRLLRMDIRPATHRRGFGLSALQKASAGRAILDYLTAAVNWEQLKLAKVYHNCMFGMSGTSVWTKLSQAGLPPVEEGENTIILDPKVALEVVPPWQLYPIPHNPTSSTEVEGVRRARWVPLDWAKDRRELSISSDEEKMRVREAAYGFKPNGVTGISVGPLSPSINPMGPETDFSGSRSKGRKGVTKTETKYVLLEEFFLFRDEPEQLRSYTVKIGDHEALHEDYTDSGVYMPIGRSTYHPIGGFYGRSFVEILIPMNAAMERMASNLFQNIEDLDLFGALLVPQMWGISKREFLDRRTKRKVLFYQPDLTLPEAKADRIQPANMGDAPGKTLAFANSLMDRLANQSDLLRGDAPGRVDSQTGLSFLQETSQIPLSVPAGSIAGDFSQVYRVLLSRAPVLLKGRNSVPLLGLDDSIVGLKVMPNSGEIQLDPRNFPAPFEVDVDIRDKLPVLPAVREEKLKESLKLGLITPDDFRFTVWKENLDFPVGRDALRCGRRTWTSRWAGRRIGNPTARLSCRWCCCSATARSPARSCGARRRTTRIFIWW